VNETLPTILVLAMLAITAAKTLPIMRASVPGSPELDVRVPLLFRALGQRVNIVCVLAVLLLGSGLVGDRWIPHGLFAFALLVLAGLIALPNRYRFTAAGVSPSPAVFRPWSDFERWDANGNLIVLLGKGRFGSLKLYVTSHDREAVTRLVRRHLKANR